MKVRKSTGSLWSIALAVLALFGATGLDGAALAQQARWRSDYFPNVVLQDQDGRPKRFYDDLVRGKVVAINFVYTTCKDICPLDTAKSGSCSPR